MRIVIKVKVRDIKTKYIRTLRILLDLEIETNYIR